MTGKPRLSYDEAVEEALCFGWIDSRPNTLDAERAMLRFSPRRAGSPWSTLNTTRLERLIAGGVMTDAGLAKIEAAKADGSWTIYDVIEDLVIPDDLAAALQANATADDHFRNFGAAAKKQLLWWIANVKHPATRATQIERIVTAAAINQNLLRSPQARS